MDKNKLCESCLIHIATVLVEAENHIFRVCVTCVPDWEICVPPEPVLAAVVA